MKVVLVSLYDINSFAIRSFHALLEKHNFNVQSIFFKEHYSNEDSSDDGIAELCKKILELKPTALAFAVRSPMFPLFKRIIKELPPDLLIVAGGHHCIICPEDIIKYANVVCVGEGEKPLLDLCYRLRSKKPIAGINDMWVRTNGVIVKGKRNTFININDVPIPRYSKDGSQVYVKGTLDYENKKSVEVLTTRGCFFDCSFCYNDTLKKLGISKVRRRSVDNVMAELALYKKLFPKLEEVVFADNVFTYNKKWLEEFCKRFPIWGLKFRCFSHFKMMNKEILTMIKDAGCHMVTAGIQSHDERIRKEVLGKGETNEDIIKGSKLLAKIGFDEVRYDFLVDTPYRGRDVEEERKDFINLLERPFTIRKIRLMHFPKTELTERLLNTGLISYDDVQGRCTISYREWVDYEKYN